MDAKTLCLGLLTQGEASGYEIKKQMEKGPLAHFYRAGFGSIYPALSRLEQQGFVTCTEMAQEKRPGKKVYRITESGIAAFREKLRTRPNDDWVRSDHLFMLFFSEFLEAGAARGVLEGYLGFFRNALADLHGMELRDRDFGQRFVHGFGMALYEASIDYLESHREEMDQAGREERGGPAHSRKAGALG